MTSSAKNRLNRITSVLAAVSAAIVLAFATASVDQASASGGYGTSSYNGCPASAPYYKVSYTGYALCSRYP